MVGIGGFVLIHPSRSVRSESGSAGQVRLPESPALRFLASKGSFSFLLLLHRGDFDGDMVCLQSGLDFLAESPTGLFQDCWKALADSEGLVLSIRDSEKQRPLASLAKRNDARQLLLLPIPENDGQVRGYLIGAPGGKEPLSASGMRWLGGIANRIHGKISGEEDPEADEAYAGWVGAEIGKREAETERDARGEALLTLAEATRELCRSWEPEAMLRTILSLAVRLIAPARCGALFLFEEGFLTLKETEGFPPGSFQGLRIAPGESLPGKAFATRKPIRLISQAAVLATAANFSPENRRIFTEGFQPWGIPSSAIAAPLLVREEPIGVILLDSFLEGHPFSQRDLELLEQFANLCAVVLETSRFSDLAQLRAFLLDRVQDAVITFDVEGRLRSHNAGARKLWGWEKAPETFTDLFEPTSRPDAERAVMEALRTQHSTAELTALRVDGRGHPLLVSISILRTQRETFFVAIFADLGERNRMQRMLLQSARMESVATLAGGLAHDFNNLLGIIHGYSSFLRMRLAGNAEGLEELSGLESAAQRAAELTGQLIAVGRGRRHLDFRPTHLDSIVSESLPMLRKTLGSSIEVRLSVEKPIPETSCDPLALQEILVNLALNARDAMPQGGTFRLQLRVIEEDSAASVPPARVASRWICLEASDTGRGMDAEILSRIYEPFFTTKEEPDGAGLGCTMIYSIVRAHGGWIEAESAPEQGTTFRIYLPTA